MADITDAGYAPAKSAAGETASGSRWFMVVIVTVAVMVAFFDRINVGVLFTDKAFLTTMGILGKPAMMGMLMTAFVFAYGISALLLSFLSDVIGPRKTLASIALVLAVTMGWMEP